MWPCEDQYSRDQAIAQSRIPKYRSARANEGHAMAETGLTYAGAGVDLDAGKRVVKPIKPLLGSTAQAGGAADPGRLDLGRGAHGGKARPWPDLRSRVPYGSAYPGGEGTRL